MKTSLINVDYKYVNDNLKSLFSASSNLLANINKQIKKINKDHHSRKDYTKLENLKIARNKANTLVQTVDAILHSLTQNTDSIEILNGKYYDAKESYMKITIEYT